MVRMGFKKATKRPKATVNEAKPPPNLSPSHTLQTLISAIQSPQGITLPLLKSLYFFLVHISLNEPVRSSSAESALDYLDGCLEFEDIHSLADLLFEELHTSFKFLYSDECAKASIDELTLLLRCCMLSLTLADQNVVLEKTIVLLSVLRKIISLVRRRGNDKSSIRFQKSASRESSYNDASCSVSVSEDFFASLSILEFSDPCRPLLCAVLEVFADELLMHKSLTECFILADSTSSRAMFKCHSFNADAGIVLEVISIHFIQSISDEQAFEKFLNRSSCKHGKDFRVPELSLTVAVSLLLNPIILSSPKLFHAHLVLLVSEAIDTGMFHENRRPDLRHKACYLTAFESSVILYTKHMSSLLQDGHHMGAKYSANSCMFGSCPPFESFIQEVTRDKIYDTITKSDSLWDSHVCNTFIKTKSDLVAESIAYINKSECVDESCKDDVLSILGNIILGALSDGVGDTALYKKGDTSLGDVYLLASLLKLMSDSMLNAIWYLRLSVNLGCSRTLEDASCKEYDFIVGVIDCFQQFPVYLPYQKLLFDKMKTNLSRHKTSKWMLLHFVGLLSLSFASGVNFLVKGCVSTIMTLLNLYVLEEGNVVALKSLLDSVSESSSSKLSSEKVGKAPFDGKSSKKIASKFQKIQKLRLRTNSFTCFHQRSENEMAETLENTSILNCTRESALGIEEETEESCNGTMFLNCILEGSHKISDFDDLANFIECDPRKDYSSWFKEKKRYRKQKYKKMAVLRWERKKRTLKSMMAKKP